MFFRLLVIIGLIASLLTLVGCGDKGTTGQDSADSEGVSTVANQASDSSPQENKSLAQGEANPEPGEEGSVALGEGRAAESPGSEDSAVIEGDDTSQPELEEGPISEHVSTGEAEDNHINSTITAGENVESDEIVVPLGVGSTEYVLFPPSGNFLAIVNSAGIELRQPQTLELVHFLLGRTSHMGISPDGRFLLRSVDRKVELWDIDVMERKWSYTASEVRGLAFSRQGNRFVTIHYDAFRIWDLETHALICTFPSEGWDGPSSASFSPDGKLIVAAAQPAHLVIGDATTGVIIGVPQVSFTGAPTWVEFSPCENSLAVISDSTMRVLDIDGTNIRERWRLSEAYGSPIKACWDPQGEFIAAGYSNGYIRLFSAHDGSCIQAITDGYEGYINSITVSSNGLRLAVSIQNKLNVWNLADGQLLYAEGGEMEEASYSPAGKLVAVAGKGVSLLSVEEMEVVQTLQGKAPIAWSADGQYIATNSSHDSVKVWNTLTGELVREFQRPPFEALNSLAFSPDSKLLAAVGEFLSYDGNRRTRVQIWNAETGGTLNTIDTYNRVLEFSPEGKFLFNGSLYQISTWEPVLSVHEPYSAAFTPDGEFLAVGSEAVKVGRGTVGEIDIFALGKSQQVTQQEITLVTTLEGNAESGYLVAISPTGSYLAGVPACSSDGIELWRVGRYEPVLSEITNMSSGLPSFWANPSFSPDGENLITIHDGTPLLWTIGAAVK